MATTGTYIDDDKFGSLYAVDKYINGGNIIIHLWTDSRMDVNN
jgi:hypothetical protein